jgi:hypothetical protein
MTAHSSKAPTQANDAGVMDIREIMVWFVVELTEEWGCRPNCSGDKIRGIPYPCEIGKTHPRNL